MKSIVALAFAGAFTLLTPAAMASQECKAPAGHDAHSHCGGATADGQSQGAVYKAKGSVKDVNKAAGKVTISHDPVAELHWPAMTMRFGVSDRKLLDELAAGRKIDFRFVQRGSDYIVTALY
jgi:Cu(I)/Ag(I) efflux system periplasmic protein CusF